MRDVIFLSSLDLPVFFGVRTLCGHHMCHVARELAPGYFDGSRHVSVLRESSCVTTLQGCLVTRLSEALGRSSGMTLSRLDLVFVWLCEKCSAMQGDLFHCLITCLRV